jgi:hypothetical protein
MIVSPVVIERLLIQHTMNYDGIMNHASVVPTAENLLGMQDAPLPMWTVAWLNPRKPTLRFRIPPMASTKSDVKSTIDTTAESAKDAAGCAIDKTKEAGQTVKEKAQAAGEYISEKASEAATTVGNAVKDAGDAIKRQA